MLSFLCQISICHFNSTSILSQAQGAFVLRKLRLSSLHLKYVATRKVPISVSSLTKVRQAVRPLERGYGLGEGSYVAC